MNSRSFQILLNEEICKDCGIYIRFCPIGALERGTRAAGVKIANKPSDVTRISARKEKYRVFSLSNLLFPKPSIAFS